MKLTLIIVMITLLGQISFADDPTYTRRFETKRLAGEIYRKNMESLNAPDQIHKERYSALLMAHQDLVQDKTLANKRVFNSTLF